MDQITIDDVLNWAPCDDYATRTILLKVTGDRKQLTPLEVTELTIPATDILWVLLRPKILDERSLRLYACDVAEHVAHLWKMQANSTWKPADTISVARAFANGETSWDRLCAAAYAARTAASVARIAAYDAYNERWLDVIAASAATDTAATTGMRAGRSAANTAAQTDPAEDQWQLERLRDYLQHKEYTPQ